MLRFVLRGLAVLFVVGAFVGCQDSSVVNPSSESSSEAPSSSSETKHSGLIHRGLGQCDDVVGSGGSIQGAVNGAGRGDVICIRPGRYKEQISVNESVVLRGQTPATSGNPVVIEGWVSLDAEGAEVRRVVVTREEPFDTPPDPFGVRVTASNTTVAETVVQGIGEAVPKGSINGIQVFGASSLSNIEIEDNLVRNYRNADDGTPVFGVAGIKIQADVSDVQVTGNEVRNLHGLYGYGVVVTTSRSDGGIPRDVLIAYNTLEGINDGSVFDVFSTGGNQGRGSPGPFPGSAVGIDGNASADEVKVRLNNLLAPNGVESKDEEDELSAKCNWWGDRSGPTDDENAGGTGTWALERGAAEIDYTPWLIAPSPSHACLGGTNLGGGKGPGLWRGTPGENAPSLR